MKNIMLDLETLDTETTGLILSIGAVEFDLELGVSDSFYVNIDPQTCIDKGLTISGSTLNWWMEQSFEARKALTGKQISLKEALTEFRNWLNIPRHGTQLQVWGNGCDFDNAMLQHAYSKFRVSQPWPFWSNRCFRTIKSSYPKIELPSNGTKHNALDDATWQAEYLIKLVEKNKLKQML